MTDTKESLEVIRIATSALDKTQLTIRDVVAWEYVGRPFIFDIQMVSPKDDLDFATVLGTHFTLEVDIPSGGQRYLDGIVTAFTYVGEVSGKYTYQATLRPWLWLLTRNIQTRIYQGKTVPVIIKEVFKNAGFDDITDRLGKTDYLSLEYCVQYQESDFAFVHRLMEQEGIYYFFEHTNGHHKLVLADQPSAHVNFNSDATNCDKIRYFSEKQKSDEKEVLVSWILTQEVQSGNFTIRDYDFTQPSADLEKKKKIVDEQHYGTFEIYEYPGKYKEPSDGENYAELRIEEQAAQFARAIGDSHTRWLAAGCLITVTDAPRTDQNGKFLILETKITTSKQEGQSWDVTFHAMPTKHGYRMPRTTPKPRIRGPQTAIVTGEAGEEIYTDKYASVKVQFYWDRYGNKDEKSSCWIRCAQPWAANQWGTVFIPRLKQEVVVHFMEGDPDRPLITGAVYNGDNASPITLPDNKTQSGIMSNTSKGGGGFNQIRFEDKAGSEELYVHAQKDNNIEVLNNRTIKVGQDLTETTQKGNRSITVSKGDETKEVTAGKQTVTIKGDQGTTIQSGNHTVTVSAGTSSLTAQGAISQKSSDSITHEATSSLTLKVGSNSIKIDSSGVTIEAAMISLKATGEVTVNGITVEVKADAETTVKGGIVMVNSG